MWRDIAVANRANLARSLGEFIKQLDGLRKMVRAGDEAALTRFFAQAKQRRDAWCHTAGQASTE
jgi:prephenate dehydrogenase